MANKNLGTADVATSVQQTDSVLSEIGGAVRRVKVKDLSRSLNLSITSPEVYAYGIEFDVTVSSTAATRIGNMSMHRTLPVQTLMKGCLLDDDGNVVDYLDPQDWSKATRDGSRGQVMVELPEYYEKFETDGNKRRAWMSLEPLAGFRKVPKRYVSAYQAYVKNSKLCSIAGVLASSNISRTGFRNAARARKTGSAEWNCHVYDIQRELYWLFAIEYAQLSCQTNYNAALTTEGYHQGGLGSGVIVSDWNKWTTYNGNNPFVHCGTTDSLGNRSGVVTYDTGTKNGVTLGKVSVNRYRGIECPFAHVWNWTDGINIEVQAGDSGVSKVYVCRDPKKFSDTGYNGYTYVGNEARTEGFVTQITFGEYGDITAKAVGGSDSSYHGDYHYTNIPTATTLRGVLFGGTADNGSSCGFVYSNSSNAPSGTHASIASRLCFLPAA
ncbi:MAG: hypothetical protein SO154_05385 [Prevotella sp.]|nr:hypothetical protein [Prevotella sp.]